MKKSLSLLAMNAQIDKICIVNLKPYYHEKEYEKTLSDRIGLMPSLSISVMAQSPGVAHQTRILNVSLSNPIRHPIPIQLRAVYPTTPMECPLSSPSLCQTPHPASIPVRALDQTAQMTFPSFRPPQHILTVDPAHETVPSPRTVTASVE